MSESSQTPTSKPLLSDWTYSKLKHTAMIVLPAVSALYISLAQIWNFPKVEEVAGSITAMNTFLGALVAFSTRKYNNSDAKYAGVIQVDDSGDTKKVSLVVNGDPEEVLSSSNEVTFKVSDTGEHPIINP